MRQSNLITSSDPNRLTPLWDELLQIYLIFQGLCKKHGLRHFAFAGTLLGAVRHRGFIPWDDDFDVMMPWEDYCAFLRIAEKELPSHLKIVNMFNTPEFGFFYAKIQNTRVEDSNYVSRVTGHPQNEGLFIDIFPFSGQTTNEGICSRLKPIFYRLCWSARVQKHFPTLKSRLAHALSRPAAVFAPNLRCERDFYSVMVKKASEVDFDNARDIAHFDSHLFDFNFRYRRIWFEKTVSLPFESVEIPSPENYDDVLRATYGDYMKLPPLESRHFTHSNCPPAPWKFGPTRDCLDSIINNRKSGHE